jgi:hypothetical protein
MLNKNPPLSKRDENDNLAKNAMKYNSVGSSPKRLKEKTNKKLFPTSLHDNSDEFINLGTLHRERR